MISIKKLISLDSPSEKTLVKVIHTLLLGIGQHAVQGDAGERVSFHEHLNTLSDDLADGIDSDELLLRVGSVLNALQDHCRRSTALQSLQTVELKNMVKMLTTTVAEISAASQSNIGVLGDIERQVASVSELNDIRVMKAKLSDCLREIQKEAERQSSETAKTVERLNEEVAQARQQSAGTLNGQEKDPITGLCLRRDAEAAVTNYALSGSRAFASLLVFNRVQFLNQRFGRDIGDEILHAFAQMLQQRLRPSDQLFRWGGPAFLALLPRPESIEQVRGEILRITNARVEHTVKTRSIDVLIPLTACWTVFPVTSAPRLLFQKLDAFAATPAVT